MKKNVITFLIVIFLTSCGGGSGIDNSIQTHNVIFNEKDIVGNWKLDKFSYKYLFLGEEKEIDSIYIIFNEDNTFKLNNSSDLFKNSPHGIIDNKISNGKWKITKYENKSDDLSLIYDNNVSLSNLNVYKKGKEYQIWCFFGDPDTGERLRFLKTE